MNSLTFTYVQDEYEGEFSQLKIIKIRLKSRLTDEHLVVFMLMATKTEIINQISKKGYMKEVCAKIPILAHVNSYFFFLFLLIKYTE